MKLPALLRSFFLYLERFRPLLLTLTPFDLKAAVIDLKGDGM
jgi:hypothetical protein